MPFTKLRTWLRIKENILAQLQKNSGKRWYKNKIKLVKYKEIKKCKTRKYNNE